MFMQIIMAEHLPSNDEREAKLRAMLLARRRQAIINELNDPDFQLELKLAKESYWESKRLGRKYTGPAFKIPHITYLWIDRTFPEVVSSSKELRKFLRSDSVLANFIIG